MVFLLAAVALLLHLLVWGAGAALLLTPRPWRRFWPVFCAPMGLALQSAVVWAGAYSNLAGAEVYARWTEVIPVVLLALAWRKAGRTEVLGAWRRFWAVGLIVLVIFGMLVLPMARASRTLTTLSLGSCDAADYAAGARVLQEFARTERGGFIGLTEVVQVASVDNFYDFWLRLNHFTPSALIAFNGAVFGWQPYQITGLMTALLLAVSLPAVFWMARAVMRYSRRTSLWLAAAYGLNPITWYAVAHVATGQLLAAHAVVFLTWAGVALWRCRLTWARGWAMAGVLAMAYWIVLGSYNFIVVVCLVPGLAFAGGHTLLKRDWRKFGRWLAVMLVPLVACGAIFTQRTLGLLERFQLFGQYDFGWRIPALTPEGWLGAVSGPALEPLPIGPRLVLVLLLFALLVTAMVRDLYSRGRGVFLMAALTLPILVGYGYLEFRGEILRTNASYDAYKLLAVFFPAQLCGYCYWTGLTRSPRRGQRWAAYMGIAVVMGFNLAVVFRFARQMEDPPLIVDHDLAQLQQIEQVPGVASINLHVQSFWSRLWANSFLLKKPHYFRTHTYEGRLNTALKGDWDLSDNVVSVTAPPEAGTLRFGRAFTLVDTRSPYFMRAGLANGWYPEERIARAGRRWHWSKDGAALRLENPQATPRTVDLHLWARSVVERDLQVWQGPARCGTVEIEKALGEHVVRGIVLPPGETILALRSSVELTRAGADDARQLGFAIYGVEVEVKPLPGTASGR